jgi:hypothetical protein
MEGSTCRFGLEDPPPTPPQAWLDGLKISLCGGEGKTRRGHHPVIENRKPARQKS